MSTGWLHHRINRGDAAEQFERLGFQESWLDERHFEIVYFRKCELANLYERIAIKAGGKQGEAVAAYTEISLVRGESAVKGLVEVRPLCEVATNRERCQTIINSRSEGLAWLKRVRITAPMILREMIGAQAQALLTSRRTIIESCKKYVKLVRHVSSLDEYILSHSCNKMLMKEAERIVDWAGVLQVHNGRNAYLTAALLLLIHNLELDPDLNFTSMNPFADKELFWRIQLLVDHINYDIFPDSSH